MDNGTEAKLIQLVGINEKKLVSTNIYILS